MGVESEIFASSSAASRQGAGVFHKVIWPHEIADLDWLVTGEEDREPQCVQEEGECMTFVISVELQAALARLPDQSILAHASEWQVGGGTEDVTLPLLQEICALAKDAWENGRHLYLRISP